MTSKGRKNAKSALPDRLIGVFDNILDDVAAQVPSLRPRTAVRVIEALRHSAQRVSDLAAELDPIKEPFRTFDPNDPKTVGTIVAIALLMQKPIPMKDLTKAYGSGVYAIYYTGSHPTYAPISGSETPIYVGKADPKVPDAVVPRQQGTKLADRLIEHRGSIEEIERHALAIGDKHPMLVSDFWCRMLVVSGMWHLAAERQLISLFRPVWNQEMKICYGMSKHGDREARLNSRSPWHVLHPGVDWALNPKLPDARPLSRIMDDIAAHFEIHKPFRDVSNAITRLISEFAQHSHESESTEDDGLEADSESLESNASDTPTDNKVEGA